MAKFFPTPQSHKENHLFLKLETLKEDLWTFRFMKPSGALEYAGPVALTVQSLDSPLTPTSHSPL